MACFWLTAINIHTRLAMYMNTTGMSDKIIHEKAIPSKTVLSISRNRIIGTDIQSEQKLYGIVQWSIVNTP